MSGSPPRFHCTFPLTLSLSKGEKTIFQQPAKPGCCRVSVRSQCLTVLESQQSSLALGGRPSDAIGVGAPRA